MNELLHGNLFKKKGNFSLALGAIWLSRGPVQCFSLASETVKCIFSHESEFCLGKKSTIMNNSKNVFYITNTTLNAHLFRVGLSEGNLCVCGADYQDIDHVVWACDEHVAPDLR